MNSVCSIMINNFNEEKYLKETKEKKGEYVEWEKTLL